MRQYIICILVLDEENGAPQMYTANIAAISQYDAIGRGVYACMKRHPNALIKDIQFIELGDAGELIEDDSDDDI